MCVSCWIIRIDKRCGSLNLLGDGNISVPAWWQIWGALCCAESTFLWCTQKMKIFWNASIDGAKELSTTHKSLATEDPIASFYHLLVCWSHLQQQGPAGLQPTHRCFIHVVAQEHNCYFLLGNICGGGERLQHRYLLNPERRFTSEVDCCPIIIWYTVTHVCGSAGWHLMYDMR